MTAEYVVNGRKNIYDVSLDVYGTSALAYQLATTNGITVDSSLTAGTVLKYDTALGVPDVKQAYTDRQISAFNFYEEPPPPPPVLVTLKLPLLQVGTSLYWLRSRDPDFIAAASAAVAGSGGSDIDDVELWQVFYTGSDWLVNRGILQVQIPAGLEDRDIISARFECPTNDDLGAGDLAGTLYEYTGGAQIFFSEFSSFGAQITTQSQFNDLQFNIDLNTLGLSKLNTPGPLRFMGRSAFDINQTAPPTDVISSDSLNLAQCNLVITYYEEQ